FSSSFFQEASVDLGQAKLEKLCSVQVGVKSLTYTLSQTYKLPRLHSKVSESFIFSKSVSPKLISKCVYFSSPSLKVLMRAAPVLKWWIFLRREPHSQIEKRRRDKMNNLIDELSTMIPSCQPLPRKLDKLTVLRKAVQHLKTLRGKRSTSKPPILPHDDLRRLLLRAADGFLLVVTCDRAKILFISESVSKVLNFSQLELTGQSLLIDSATPVSPQPEASPRASLMSTGARRSFFCRMKHSRVSAKQSDKLPLLTSKKKDAYRYCTLHCTGYMGSWPGSDLDLDLDSNSEPSPLSCLVTVCRLHPHTSTQTSKDQVNTKPIEFITRCSIDGKFIFVDQQATTITGYLPQEVLGTSWYEYFHHDDLQHLAEKHREVLRSKEKIQTRCYKFRTKYGPYMSLQSEWFTFTNPWTKEIEFIVSLNRVVTGEKACAVFRFIPLNLCCCLSEVSKELPIIPGLSSGVGTMIYAGSIGTQIANELIDIYFRDSGLLFFYSFILQFHFSLHVPGEPSHLDDVAVPGLSSFSSDEAAMAVIMSLLETDATLGQSGDFTDLHWPF
uniref:Aryl hydrocarbon receptor nuclear translocator like 2 n=1 Tax=Neogobius melanostomus TaxID=47308 RepID=A0A8C6U6W3_9GOBI